MGNEKNEIQNTTYKVAAFVLKHVTDCSTQYEIH